MNQCARIPPIIYFSSTPESLQETESSLTRTPPVWTHMLHCEEPDHFCPCGIHKDAFIPCSASILTQNGTYWHQVNSLPTTGSQCCTSSVCSRAAGFYFTFRLDCMEPADAQGEVEVEVKAEAVTRGIVHDSQIQSWCESSGCLETGSSCCQRGPSLTQFVNRVLKSELSQKWTYQFLSREITALRAFLS